MINGISIQFSSEDLYNQFKDSYFGRDDLRFLQTINRPPENLIIPKGFSLVDFEDYDDPSVNVSEIMVWNRQNWGTPYEVENDEINWDDDSLFINGCFDTYDAPPIKAYEKLLSKWDASIEAYYLDIDADICGTIEFSEEQQVHNKWDVYEFLTYVEVNPNTTSEIESMLFDEIHTASEM